MNSKSAWALHQKGLTTTWKAGCEIGMFADMYHEMSAFRCFGTLPCEFFFHSNISEMSAMMVSASHSESTVKIISKSDRAIGISSIFFSCLDLSGKTDIGQLLKSLGKNRLLLIFVSFEIDAEAAFE